MSTNLAIALLCAIVALSAPLLVSDFWVFVFIEMLVFGLGAGLAGLAGGLSAPIMSIGPGLHAQVLIDAFVIVVLGGMGSLPGALIGALLVGQANAFGTLAFPTLAIMVPFIVMTVLLVVRPWGLMGKPE